jgi:hypothetical protein
MDIVRVCTRCGHPDLSRVWPTLEDAAATGAGWACPICAWPEFDLRERRAVSRAPALVPDIDADEAWDAGPVGLDPDEARRVDVLRLR